MFVTDCLIDLEITDPKGFQEYVKLAGPSQKYCGRG
jgi:hypothetical protein